MNNLVSIIVPVYNSENYIQDCIDSLINQTYKNIEIIIVNDGSIDNSLDICRKYEKHENVKIINKENGGVSSARNVGLKNSNGDYVIFVDSDDMLPIESIEERMLFYKEDYLLISGYSTNNCVKNTQVINIYNNEKEVSILSKNEIVSLYKNGSLNSPCDKFYNNRLIKEKNLKFNEQVDLGEDLIFNMEYIRNINKGFIYINKPLYSVMVRGNISLCRKYHSNIFEIQIQKNSNLIKVIKEIKNIPKQDLDYIYIKYLDDMLQAIYSILLNQKKSNIVERYYKCLVKLNSKEYKQVVFITRKNKNINYFTYILLKNKFIITYKLLTKIKQ